MNVLFSSINSIYRTVQQPPTDLKICRGIYLFSASVSLRLPPSPTGEGYSILLLTVHALVVCFFFLLLPIADEEPRKSQKTVAAGREPGRFAQ